MAEERISSVIAPEAFREVQEFEKGLEGLEDVIVRINQNASKVSLDLGGTKTFSDLNKSLQQITDTTKELQKATSEQGKAAANLALAEQRLEQANLAAERTRTQKLKTQEQEIKNADRLEAAYDKEIAAQERAAKKAQETADAKIKQEEKILQKIEKDFIRRIKIEEELTKKTQDELKKKQQIIEQEAAKEQKILDGLSNDYTILSKAYTDAANKAKNFSATLGLNHPVAVQAQKDAQVLDKQLKAIDASVGQYQRSVGNYNIVGTQFNQLLRELPNAGINFNTFILAISNNITYFGEAVKAARAEGQSWKQILSTLGSSMLGLVGIISIATGLITYLSVQSSKASKESKKLNEELSEQDKLFQAIGQSAARETTQLRILYEQATNVNNSMELRKRAVDALQSQYPAFSANELNLPDKACTLALANKASPNS